MIDMAKKEVSAAKPADNMIYKALLDAVILCIGIFLLQYIGRNYVMTDRFIAWNEGLGVAAWVALAVGVIGAGLAFVKQATVKKIGVVAAAVGLVLAAAFGALHQTYEAMPYLYFVLIAGCSLYLIYLLYPLDFFLIATLTTLSGGAFYLHGQSSSTGKSDIILYAVIIVLAIAALVTAHKAAMNNGVIPFGKKSLRLFAGKSGATPLYLTCAITVACVAASMVLGGTFAFYCVYAAVGGLFVAACYYTIRLN